MGTRRSDRMRVKRMACIENEDAVPSNWVDECVVCQAQKAHALVRPLHRWLVSRRACTLTQQGSSTGTAHHTCHCFSCQPTRKTGCSCKEVSCFKLQKPASCLSCLSGLAPVGAECGSFLHSTVLWRGFSIQEPTSCSANLRIHRKTCPLHTGAHGYPPATCATHLGDN